MKVLYFLAAVLLAVVAEEAPALKELRNGNLVFSAKTYKELAKKNVGQNFLVCPLSVAVVLALVEAGAGEKTAEQFITGLNLPATEEKIHEAFKAIAPSLNVEDDYTLASANKIYLKEGFKIREQFKDVATKVFNAEVTDINFTKEKAAEEINNWVLKKTHDKIKDLISKGDLDDSTRAILINAIFFFGRWAHPFYLGSTLDKPFSIDSKKETTVKMMEQTNNFNYFYDTKSKVKFLELPYYNSPISMIFVLPDDVDGLEALESNIEKVLESPEFTDEKVHVQIPHINVESNIDFIPILKEFGIKDAFGGNANFSRLKENDEPLAISKIIQKTFIEVEEKGTTAAAATAVILNKLSSLQVGREQILREFNANHPFIFVVKSPNGILFVGRYVTPTNK